MARHYTLITDIEVEFIPVGCSEVEVAYPVIEITYSHTPGRPAVLYQRNGDPGWPADPDEVELVSARLLNGDGVNPTQDQVDQWACEYLDSDAGYERALEAVPTGPDPDDWYDSKRDEAIHDG